MADDTASRIKRIDDISSPARTAWFTLLGVLAFVAVTLLSITHADILLDARMIALPLVGVSVPTNLFLLLSPIVLTVLALYFYGGYLDAVRGGTKRTTIRRHDPVTPGGVRLIFDHDGPSTIVDAVVTHVESKSVAALDDDDAARDGFADRGELLAALRSHYPGIDESAEVDVVHFRLADPGST